MLAEKDIKGVMCFVKQVVNNCLHRHLSQKRHNFVDWRIIHTLKWSANLIKEFAFFIWLSKQICLCSQLHSRCSSLWQWFYYSSNKANIWYLKLIPHAPKTIKFRSPRGPRLMILLWQTCTSLLVEVCTAVMIPCSNGSDSSMTIQAISTVHALCSSSISSSKVPLLLLNLFPIAPFILYSMLD